MINTIEFYAGLTPLYHLIYPDWGKSIKRQGDMIDSVIREILVQGKHNNLPERDTQKYRTTLSIAIGVSP